MAYDGIMMASIIKDLNKSILTGRINKIYQVSKYELLMVVRSNRHNYKLLLSCHPTHARMQLTDLEYPTPESPNTLTMLFRKHLEGAYITSISQISLDRICKICFNTFNEFGDKEEIICYIEIMGKHSNIILTRTDGTIIDCLKRITPSMNVERFIQPGAKYHLPPMIENKLNPFNDEYQEGKDLYKIYEGMSPLLSSEISYRISKGETFSDIMNLIKKSNSLYISTNDKGKEVYYLIPLTQFKEYKEYPLMVGLDKYYKEIDSKERIKQQTSNLVKFISNEYQKNVNKLTKLESTLKDSKNSDDYRIKGDLLYSSLDKISKGMNSIEVENYYDGTKLKISLDPKLDAKANAQKYYNKYQKAKNSINVLNEQIDLTNKEIDYFDSLNTLISNASYYDALEIKEELENLGYLKKKKIKKSSIRKKKAPSFEVYFTKDNIEIDVGKNNLQNDYLTFKYAGRFDMWFHVKDAPGSHVIVRSDNLDEYTIRLAANIAALFSKSKNSSSVPVNYTLIKTLKKPSGAKPGKVILDSYKTIYIDPDENVLDELTKK